MSGNPFDDMHQIFSNGHIPSGQTISFTGAVQVPILQVLPTRPANGTTDSRPRVDARQVSLSPPVRWSAADLNYLLGALFPDQTVAGDILLEQRRQTPLAPSSPVHLGLFLRTRSQQRPASTPAFSAAAPVGTGRPATKRLIAQVTGATEQAARRALAKAVLSMGVSLRHVTTQHLVLSHLYRYPVPGLQSIKRGIKGMAEVGEVEWVERMVQMRAVKKDGMPWFEARLEVLLLEGGFSGLSKWAGIVDVALELEEKQRLEWADTYEGVVGFLENVAAGLNMVEE